MSYREKCKMYTEVSMGNPGKVPYCLMTGKLEPDCSKCERPDVTKADRFRAMSDEELAELIGDHIDCSVCKKVIFHSEDCPATQEKGCFKTWLDWLRQEATDGKQD